MLHHEIEPDDYLDAVHAIAVEELLEPDRALDAMLATLPHRKVIFTNGSTAHAERVLACLERARALQRRLQPRARGVRSETRAGGVRDRARASRRGPPPVPASSTTGSTTSRRARALGMRTILVGDADETTPIVRSTAGSRRSSISLRCSRRLGIVMSADDAFSLYVHIPYCQAKCPYCDFNSYAATTLARRRLRRARSSPSSASGPRNPRSRRQRRRRSSSAAARRPLFQPATIARLLDAHRRDLRDRGRRRR